MKVTQKTKRAGHRTFERTEVRVVDCYDCPFGVVGRHDEMDWWETATCDLTGTTSDADDTPLEGCPLKKAGKRGKRIQFFLEEHR